VSVDRDQVEACAPIAAEHHLIRPKGHDRLEAVRGVDRHCKTVSQAELGRFVHDLDGAPVLRIVGGFVPAEGHGRLPDAPDHRIHVDVALPGVALHSFVRPAGEHHVWIEPLPGIGKPGNAEGPEAESIARTSEFGRNVLKGCETAQALDAIEGELPQMRFRYWQGRKAPLKQKL
jgi:hypothetical protein